MLFIVDRLEENWAVIEKTQDDVTEYIDVERTQLPLEVQEGDVLLFNKGVWTIDHETTQARRDQMEQRLKRLGLL